MLRHVTAAVAGALVVVGGFAGWHAVDGAADGDLLADAPAASSTTSRAVSQRGASRSPCPRPAPRDASEMNALFTSLDRFPSLQGADHGGSVALDDGRRMFVYGDTIRDPAVHDPWMVANSALVQDDGCLAPVRVRGDGSVIPRGAKDVYWPMSLRSVPTASGTRVEVVTTRVRRRPGTGAFRTAGPGLAVFDVPRGRMPRLVSRTDIGPDDLDPTHPTWGAAMWESGGHLYLFGTASNATKTTRGWSLHVARTRPGAITEQEDWEYWDGSTWVRGRPDVATTPGGTLVPADQGVSHVLSVFEREGSWYAVSKEGDFTGSRLAIWKSPAVTGPWSKHVVGPLPNDDRLRRYVVLAHPDYETSSGRLLVSYNQSPWTYRDYRSSPHLYRPQFLEVDLP